MRKTAQILILTLSLVLPVSVAAKSLADKECSAPFYANLKTASDITAFILDFIHSTPGCYDAYWRLVEHSVLTRNTGQAKSAFRRLAQQEKHRQYALWMLAKLYELENRPDRANHCFRRAIQADKPPWLLAVDYLDFDQYRRRRYGALDFLLAHSMHTDFSHFCAAYDQYQRSRPHAADSLYQLIDRQDRVELYHFRGKNLNLIDRTVQADSLFKHGLLLAVEQGNLRMQTLLECDCFSTCSPQDALYWIGRAEQSASATGDTLLMTAVGKNQAYLDRQSGRHEQAAAKFQEAAATAELFQQLREAARLYYHLAETYYRVYSLSDAMAAAEKCLELSDRIDDHFHRAAAQEMLGKIYTSFQIPKLAKLHFHQALLFAKSIDREMRIKRLEGLIQDVDAKCAPPSIGIKFYRKRAEFFQNAKDTLSAIVPLLELGRLHLLLDQADSSMIAFRQALVLSENIGKKNQQAWAVMGIAEAYLAQGDIDGAIPVCRLALEFADEMRSPRIALWVYANLGLYYFSKQNYQESIVHLTRAVDLIESSRTDANAEELRAEFLSRKRWKIYKALCECYYHRYKVSGDALDLQQIYRLLEMMQARTLKDRLLQPELRDGSPNDQEYVQACRKLRQKQATLRELQDGETDKMEKLLQDIEIYKQWVISSRIKINQRRKAADDAADLPTPTQLQERLGDISVLLYHIGDEASFVLVINRQEVAVIDLSIRQSDVLAQIDSLILPLHQVDAAGLQRTPFHADIAHRLYRALFAPIEARITLRNIGIVASDDLAALPFELLLTQPPIHAVYLPTDEPDYAASFLAQQFSISYAPSALFFQEPTPAKSSGQMLIVANPAMPAATEASNEVTLRLRTGWRFDPLIYAELEGKNIRQINRRARLLKHQDAAESRIKQRLNGQSIVHFASHAYVDTSFDAFSGLVLARDQEDDDGILMGFEIGEMRMDCDLVTLSACETGRGRVVRGEGVMGLPRQFLSAGAASVIMSHWKVDDRFTSSFMPLFYKHYFNGGSKARALQQARMEILTERPALGEMYPQHPFFWAAFSLYGQPEKTVYYRSSVRFFAIGAAVLVILFMGAWLTRARRATRTNR